MKNVRKTYFLILITAILLVSCAPQVAEESPTPDVNAIMTQSVGTFVALFFQTQTAMVTPATPTPLNTPTSIATSTPLALSSPFASPTIFYTAIVYPSVTPTGTQYTPTPNTAGLAYGCNNMLLIRDETIPSGTVMKPGETFTKTWKVANNGTCNWLFGYRLVPSSGANLAEDAVAVKNPPVPPGEWRQLSVNMTAPKDPGTYTQYWRLSDGAGNVFGSTLGVSIVVASPTKTPVPPTNTPGSYP